MSLCSDIAGCTRLNKYLRFCLCLSQRFNVIYLELYSKLFQETRNKNNSKITILVQSHTRKLCRFCSLNLFTSYILLSQSVLWIAAVMSSNVTRYIFLLAFSYLNKAISDWCRTSRIIHCTRRLGNISGVWATTSTVLLMSWLPPFK